MKILHPPTWPRPKGYSNGISVGAGRMIFTAGVIGWNEQEIVTSHLFEVQFGQALRNIAAILAEDGAEPRHIVRLTIYVTDCDQYRVRRDELAAVWKSVMGDHYPAVALVEVKGLVNSSAVVEIEATAVVED
ncbi:MAG: RidA family protein [Sphingomicrobium sp.]